MIQSCRQSLGHSARRQPISSKNKGKAMPKRMAVAVKGGRLADTSLLTTTVLPAPSMASSR